MRMELLENGCLKILLTGEDLTEYAMSFDTLDYRSAATRATLQRLMQTAADQLGFAPAEHMLIEALPVDDGCLLLITPEKAGCRIRLKKACGPYIYQLDSTDRLLQVAEGLARLSGQNSAHGFFGSSSLYRCEEGFWLVLYPGKALSDPVSRLLYSLARRIGEGDAAAAFTAEHGFPLAIGDALDRLKEAYSA